MFAIYLIKNFIKYRKWICDVKLYYTKWNPFCYYVWSYLQTWYFCKKWQNNLSGNFLLLNNIETSTFELPKNTAK